MFSLSNLLFQDIPVLFVYLHVDEMVFRGLGKYKNMELVNIETNYEDISKDIKQTEHDKEKGLPEEDVTTFCLWVKVIKFSMFVN